MNAQLPAGPPPLRYPPSPDALPRVLRERVDAWFAEQGRSPKANAEMWAKVALVLGLTAALYAALLLAPVGVGLRLLIWAALGFCMLEVTIGVAHDGSHGALSERAWVNRLCTLGFDLMGISTLAWPYNHLASHHASPNVGGYDAAIDGNALFRLHPAEPLGRLHRWQWLTFPLAYSLATLQKWFFLDYFTLLRGRIGGVRIPRAGPREWALLVASKLFVYTAFIVVPFAVLPDPLWAKLLGFYLLHATAGLSVAVIFQVTHLADRVPFVQPGPDGTMPLDFTRHTVHTTSEFCRKSRLAMHLCGGLNVHTTHHLFPGVCHVHLPELSDVVKQTLEEHGLPFHEYPTVGAAIRSHVRRLRSLGRPDAVPLIRVPNGDTSPGHVDT